MNSTCVAVSIEAGSGIPRGVCPSSPLLVFGGTVSLYHTKKPSHFTAVNSTGVQFSAVTARAFGGSLFASLLLFLLFVSVCPERGMEILQQ